VRHPLAGKELTVTPCICDVTFHYIFPCGLSDEMTSSSFRIVAYKIHDVVFPQLKPGLSRDTNEPLFYA
jgi:hypothetical protein